MAFVSDMGNASRTQLFDLSAQNWSPRLLSAFGIPAEILPTVVASSAPLGDCSGLSGCEGAQLASLVGDSHAALFTHFVADPGALKATYGTGTSVLVAASSERPPSNPAGIACSIVWCLDVPRYGLEGNILATGSALDWMTALLGCHDSAALEELAQAANPDSEVSLVPALNGLGAPYWQSGARALISGMTSDSGRAELAHATYEAIAHEVCDVVDAMRDGLQLPPDLLHADGGASRSRLLMQIQADLLGLPVVRSDHAAASARGAAYLAGLAVGFWSIGELGQMEASGEIFTPGEHLSTTMLRRRRWRAAVRQCLLEDGRRLRSGGSGGELGSLMEER
jgi:glycerol kinase